MRILVYNAHDSNAIRGMVHPSNVICGMMHPSNAIRGRRGIDKCASERTIPPIRTQIAGLPAR